jgi:hypothetical protein
MKFQLVVNILLVLLPRPKKLVNLFSFWVYSHRIFWLQVQKRLEPLKKRKDPSTFTEQRWEKISHIWCNFLGPIVQFRKESLHKNNTRNKEHNKLLAKSYTYFSLMFTDLDGRIMIQKQEEWKWQRKDKKDVSASIQHFSNWALTSELITDNLIVMWESVQSL